MNDGPIIKTELWQNLLLSFLYWLKVITPAAATVKTLFAA
jgi:hypothetical protein